jgi:tetratricopeptide (TPR) repeat protein
VSIRRLLHVISGLVLGLPGVLSAAPDKPAGAAHRLPPAPSVAQAEPPAQPAEPVRKRRRARPAYELPARNETEINLLPAASLTAGALPAELDLMARALRAGLGKDDLADADRILGKFDGNSGALANAAAIAWVQRSPGASLLLAVEAVRARADSANALNTLGALLCQAGYLHKGLPVLKYLAGKIPESPTVLNNLGQAWLEMGEIEKAEEYFNRCLALAPKHAAAHAAAGLIAQARGQTEPANVHFQAAVATDFSPAAAKALDRQDLKHGTPASFTRLIPVVQYFNPHHFVPPRPPQTGEEAIKVGKELEVFYGMIYAQKDRLQAQKDAAAAAWKAVFKNPDTIARQFSQTHPGAGMAMLAIHYSKMEMVEVFTSTVEKYREDIARLKSDRDGKIRHVSNCAAGKAINDAYLAACASTYGEMENKLLPLIRNGTNLQLSYLPLTSAAQSYRAEFSDTAYTYLGLVMQLAHLQVIESYTCGIPAPIGAGSVSEGEIPPFGDCPFSVSVNVYVAKLKADCKSVGFDFTAGLEFSAKKDFVSGETSLTAGLATPDFDFGKYGSAQGSAQFIVTWDRDNNLSFVGVQSEAGASYGNLAEASSELTIGVSLGPKGTGSTMSGQAAAGVIGHNIFEAKI